MERQVEIVKRLPYYQKIEHAVEFVYRFRKWIGEGYDAVLFWKSENGECYYFEAATGETIELNPVPKLISNKAISNKEFDKFIRKLVFLEIMKFATDDSHGKMRNYHDDYFILLQNGEFNHFRAICGYHRQPNFEKIVDLINNMRH